ncbi:MAG: amidohydrolase family protein, partial [Planctomycetes bacterium]|nr:amidohydrolase family protein [Planctomycetota bacterium]
GAGKAADFRLVDSIYPRDPALMELVRAGITTALIAPPAAGQVSALKLAANDPAAAVIKPYAAQYFSKSSSKTLKAAKAYHDSWVAFEKKKEAAEKKGAEFKDKAPKLTEAYEPYRALFTGAVPALVEAPNAASVPGIVALYTDQYKIRVLCSGLASLKRDENLAGMAGLLRAKTGGLVLQNPLVVKQDNKTVNWPQRLSALGVSFSVRSRVADGARLLPLQVSYAVREGWNSRLALRSMTTVPAEQFGISDRVGSIEKGKDADLVILSGEPFSLTARVLGVMVDGKLVHGVDKFKGQVDANE